MRLLELEWEQFARGVRRYLRARERAEKNQRPQVEIRYVASGLADILAGKV
jgi:hypothetical protein